MRSNDLADESLRVGLILPGRSEASAPTPVHAPGIARVPEKVHARFWERVHDSGWSVVPNLNFRDAAIVNNRVVFRGNSNCELDAYVWYCEIDRRVSSYELLILKRLSESIKVVRDPYLYERALDKHSAFALLRAHGIPVAESVLVNALSVHQAEDTIRSWGLVLLKPRRGGYGKGVTLFHNFESLRDTVEYIYATSPHLQESGIHVERFYENEKLDWTSVTIIGDTIAYGYRKNEDRFVSLGEGKFKVYNRDEIGGGVSLCAVSSQHREVALAASAVLGIEVVGFDMVLHRGQPIIVDVNTFPGMYPELFEEQGFNGGDLLFDAISRTLDRLVRSEDVRR